MKITSKIRKSCIILLTVIFCMTAGSVLVNADTESKGSTPYTVRYETSDGTELSDATEAFGQIGSEITVKPVQIDGFQSLSETYTFTLTKSGEEFVVTYRRAGGTNIGSAYGTTSDGTVVETVPDEDVPLAAGDVTGYKISTVENGEQVPLSSGEETGIPVWEIVLLTTLLTAAVAMIAIYFVKHNNEISELKSTFSDVRDDKDK